MPDTRGRPLPSEILAALKDSSITNWLRSFITQQASSMSIGRYPGNGSAQNDTYTYPDAADATHPFNFDYIIPSNFQRLVSAKLSFKIRPYRTYSTITLASTGGQSVNHHHPHTHGTHVHTQHLDTAGNAVAVTYAASASSLSWNGGGGPFDVPNINATTPASDNTAADVDHTHSVSGTSVLGIAEDAAPVNPGITVSIDGTNVTSKIGGPFNADQVEIDVTQVLATGVKLWHVLALQPNQRVRITGILRISFYDDSRLAQ